MLARVRAGEGGRMCVRSVCMLHARPPTPVPAPLSPHLHTPAQGIPLLVLGNKNDLPGALGTQELIERMGLKVG